MSLDQLVILATFSTYRPDPSCGTAVSCTEEAGSAPSITELGQRGSLCPEDSLEGIQPQTHSSRHPHAAGKLGGERGWPAKFNSSPQMLPPRDDAQQVHLPHAPEAPVPDTSGLPTQQLIINQLIIQATVELPWTLQPWTLNPALKPGQRLCKHSRGHTNRGHSWPPLWPHNRTHLSPHTDQRQAEAACLGTATLPGHSHPSQARLIKPLPWQCWQEGDFSRSRTSTVFQSALSHHGNPLQDMILEGLSQQSFKHSAATKGDNSVSLWERARLGTATIASSPRHGQQQLVSLCSEVSADSGRSRQFNLSAPAALQLPPKHCQRPRPNPAVMVGQGLLERKTQQSVTRRDR